MYATPFQLDKVSVPHTNDDYNFIQKIINSLLKFG
jgi:hypothetical protein